MEGKRKSRHVIAIEEDENAIVTEKFFFDEKLAAIVFKIDPFLPQIVESIKANETIVVIGPTGIGKSTRIPEVMAHLIKSFREKKHKLVLCTVPTRKASEELYKFQCKRTRLKIGFASNSIIQYNKSSDEIAYTTTGHLVKSFLGFIQNNKLPSHCGILMIDEAHDGKIDTFLLLSLVRYLRKNRGMSLKLIISSATIAKSTFQLTFPSATVIDIEEPHLPVKVVYHNKDFALPQDLKQIIKDMLNVLVQRQRTDKFGSKIVFLPGEFEILNFIEQAEKMRELANVKFYPAYSNLAEEELDAIFLELPPEFVCKVAVATDIFEHSLTLPGVTFILDSGLVKVMKISSDLIEALTLDFTSQSSANQRRGRTGRTCEGVCYRMYTEGKFNGFPGLCGQEIDNVPLHRPIIDLLGANLNPFEVMDDIDKERIKSDLHFLVENELVKEVKEGEALMVNYQVTEMGKFVQSLPVGLKPGIFLFHALHHYKNKVDKEGDILFAAIIVSSIFELQNAPFFVPAKGREQDDKEYNEMCADIKKKYFDRFFGESDFSTYLKLFCCYMTESEDNDKSFFGWAADNHMNNKVLKEWRINFYRIVKVMKEKGCVIVEDYTIDIERTIASMEKIFEKSFPRYIFHLSDKKDSRGKATVYIDAIEGKPHLVGRTHNNSVGTNAKAKTPPAFIMALSIRRNFNNGTEVLFLQQIFLLKDKLIRYELEEKERKRREEEERIKLLLFNRKKEEEERKVRGREKGESFEMNNNNNSVVMKDSRKGNQKSNKSEKEIIIEKIEKAHEAYAKKTNAKCDEEGKAMLTGYERQAFSKAKASFMSSNGLSANKPKYGSAKEALEAKIAAAKLKREAKELLNKKPLNPPKK